MRSISYARVLEISLVIFAMLFGAGNLMLPLKVGLLSGSKSLWGFAGFAATGVLLPLLGLLTIIGFDGDYNAFFSRVGRIPGALITLLCILALGPLIIMPRIVTFSYEMLQPFLPPMPVWLFAIGFLSLVFLATYRPGQLLAIIGKFLSPLKVVSLCIIVLAGLIYRVPVATVATPPLELLWAGVKYGFGTLDLLGTIFFGSIVVKLLKAQTQGEVSVRQRIKMAGIAGIGASLLLGLVYAGMCLLGAFHGQGLEHLNEGQLFSTVSFRILGIYGAALIGFTVFLACFTTTVALAAVVTDYVSSLLGGKIKYAKILAAVLAICLIPASFGLSFIMQFSMPVIVAFYPVLIVIAACNALYKLVGFKIIKLPVFIAFIVSLVTLLCPLSIRL
jgi:branched-chain amino acid:cation transporter, LIVCS family